jgi:hypothetical protein
MSNKSDLEALVKRCAAVVSREAALLTAWEKDPGITHARAARCRLSRRNVEDAGDDIGDVLARIENLTEPEVLRPPSQGRRDAVTALENSVAQREAMDGPTLADALFDTVLAAAEQNARRAATTAAEAFTECTS